MSLLHLTWRHLQPYRAWAGLVILFQLMATIAALLLPSLNANIIDQGIALGDVDYIWSTGITMLLITFVQATAAVLAVFFGARTAMAVGRDVRRSIYTRVDELSALDLTRFGSASLITRGTNDVQQVQMLVLMAFNFMVTAPIMSIGGIVMALREDVGLSWLVWVSVPALGVIVAILVWRLMPLFRQMQTRIDDINGVLREQIMGIRVVRAFVREPFEAQRYDAANESLTKVSLRVGTLFVLMSPVIMLVLHVATGAVLWFGGYRVDAGQMEVGALTAFLQYLLQILAAVMMGVFMMMMIPRAIVCAERIEEVLDTRPSLTGSGMTDDVAARLTARGSGRVEFTNVSFGYPGAEHPVLDDISFVAEPGQTTAIVGSTGAGKTTLLHLISRMFDPSAGEVSVSGVPLTSLTTEDLAGIVATVPQNPYLFSGTIGSNLRFGQTGATDEDLWEALRVAQGDGFVTDRHDGLDSGVSQGGTNVSGGQRQRLCIARALVAQPRVYLFDDSFSALDVATDARLRGALAEATTDATVLIVAQRVATIRDADQILVLDGGGLVGRGTHDELLETNETYREIVASQMSIEGAGQ